MTPNNLELLDMLSGQFRCRLKIGRQGRLCSSVSSPFGGWLGWLGLDRYLQLFRNLVMVASVTCKVQKMGQQANLARVVPNTSACGIYLCLNDRRNQL